MTQSEVIKKLALNLAMETGTLEDLPIYRKYIQMALCVGFEHFRMNSTEIIALNCHGIEVGRYRSISEAASNLGIAKQCITHVLHKRANTAGGYMFMKKDDAELIKIPENIKQKMTEVHHLEMAKYR